MLYCIYKEKSFRLLFVFLCFFLFSLWSHGEVSFSKKFAKGRYNKDSKSVVGERLKSLKSFELQAIGQKKRKLFTVYLERLNRLYEEIVAKDVLPNGVSEANAPSEPDLLALLSVSNEDNNFYQVSWDDLAGITSEEINIDDLVLTFLGRPVARHVVSEDTVWNVGDKILFFHEKLPEELNRYNKSATYELWVNPSDALAAESVPGLNTLSSVSAEGWSSVVLDEEHRFNAYLKNDGWYMNRLLRRGRDISASFTLNTADLQGSQGTVKVRLAGETDWPVSPDHHVAVRVNDQVVGDAFFDGQEVYDFKASTTALVPGDNTITVTSVADTGTSFGVFVIDSVELEYSKNISNEDSRLDFIGRSSRGFKVNPSFQDSDLALGFSNVEKKLYQLDLVSQEDATYVPSIGADEAYYHLGVPSSCLSVTAVSEDIVASPSGNYLILSHGDFIESPELSHYVDVKRSQGFRIDLVDIDYVWKNYGHHHRSASAINQFLKSLRGLEYVLLVGGDTYDYKGSMSDSVSYIPTAYAPAVYSHHAMLEGLLADFDGDSVADVALGRWPVRNQEELATLVQRSLDLDDRFRRHPIEAIMLMDRYFSHSGAMAYDLLSQIASLRKFAVDDYLVNAFGSISHSVSQEKEVKVTLRSDYTQALGEGADIVTYLGHGSVTSWGKNGRVVGSNEIVGVDFQRPVGVINLTCYSTNFNDASEKGMVFDWFFGNPGEVSNGATFILGSTVLSTLSSSNGVMAGLVDNFGQKSLADSLRLAQRDLVAVGKVYVIPWCFLGDPTLGLTQ